MSQIFEPCRQVLVEQFAGTNGMVTVANDQITEASVELMSLRDICEFHELGKVTDFGANCKVVICQLVRSSLQILGSGCNELGNLVVLFGEVCHLVTELGGLATPFDLDLTGERSKLIDVSGTNFLLNRQ